MKDALHDLLCQGALEEVAAMAVRRKRVLGSLVALTFDPERLISWRAVEAMGLACDRIADADPDRVLQQARRLYWLMSEESGGICWRAPEALAEIVRRRPELLAEYVPIVVFLLQEMAAEDLAHFKAGVLWGIGRLGGIGSDHVPEVVAAIAAALDDPDSQVRGMAVWCLAAVGEGGQVAGSADLLADEGPVELYEERHLTHTSVGDLVRRAAGCSRG